MEYLDTVNELNEELYEKIGESGEFFTYSYNGYANIIGFGDIQLWHSEIDDREFNEDKNEYEPLKPYIKRKFNEYIDKLNTYKL